MNNSSILCAEVFNIGQAPSTSALPELALPPSNAYKVFRQRFGQACRQGELAYLEALPPGQIEKVEESTLLDAVYATVLYRQLHVFDFLVGIPKIRDNINFAKTLKSALSHILAYSNTGIPERLLNQFAKEINLENEMNLAFLASAKSAELNLMRFLLHSPTLPYKVNLSLHGPKALLNACEAGSFEIVRYLSASTELAQPLKVEAQGAAYLFNLCIYPDLDKGSHVDMAHFLFESPLLSSHLNVAHIDKNVLTMVFENEDWKMLEYFIYNHHIESEPVFQKILSSPLSARYRPQILAILEAKNTKNLLEQNVPMPPKTHTDKIQKI